MPVIVKAVRGFLGLTIALGAVTTLAGVQAASGELAGVLKDGAGVVLPGVIVVIAAPTHREPLATVTRSDGSYRFASLPAGSYTASFRLTAFREVAREGVIVDDGKHAELNVTLALGSRQTQLTMTGSVLTKPIELPTIPVRLETEFGDIDMAVDTVSAPTTATNFLKYVDGGFYDGGRFHRTTRPDTYNPLLPNRPPMAIVQGGINPAAHPGLPPIPLERTSVTGLKHVVGVVSMARGGPDTATSDFFIMLDDQPSLDFGGKRFDDAQGAAAFGRVTAGLDVVKKIQQQPVSDRQATPDNPLTHTQNLTPPVPITKACRFQRDWDGKSVVSSSHGCSR